MSLVNITYEGIRTSIQCLKEDKMKNICNKFLSKIEKNINSLYFIYNGSKINNDLTFYEQANSVDKQRFEMDILAIPNDDFDELKCPKCGFNLNNIKIFNELINYNINISNILNELKNQIDLI